MNLHYSKTSKEDWSCYQCMYHRTLNCILLYHVLFSEKHIAYHTYANLFNYPAALHLFKCSNRHLKLLPAQKSRKYTTPKLHLKYSFLCIKFYYLMNLHYSKTYGESHIMFFWVLLPYEFTLLQNLKRGLKLLPVYVSQGFQLHFITSPFSLSRKNHINCHNVQERSERLCEISLKEYSKVAFLWFLLILYQNHPKTRSCPGERNHFG